MSAPNPAPLPHDEEAATDPRDAQIVALEAQVDALIRALVPFARRAHTVPARVDGRTLARIEVLAGQLRRARDTVEGIRPGAATRVRPVPR